MCVYIYVYMRAFIIIFIVLKIIPARVRVCACVRVKENFWASFLTANCLTANCLTAIICYLIKILILYI